MINKSINNINILPWSQRAPVLPGGHSSRHAPVMASHGLSSMHAHFSEQSLPKKPTWQL